jgi:hypothetical protein
VIDGGRDGCLSRCRVWSAEFLVVSEFFVDEVVSCESLASDDWGLKCSSWTPCLDYSSDGGLSDGRF